MGKRNKKLNETREGQLEDITVVKPKKHKLNVKSDVNITANGSVPKSKKKNRKRDIAGATIEDSPVLTGEGTNSGADTNENNTSVDSAVTKIKKKKKKKYLELNVLDSVEHLESESASNKVDSEEINSKKKKKKNKNNEECKQELDLQTGDDNTQKDIKRKGNSEDIPKIENQDVKKNKNNRSKAKTGAPALNDEEAQVTQEEIDQFCDELDEEDNKQFEDWVKLLDARLSKKPPVKK